MSYQEDVGIVAIAIGDNKGAHEALKRLIDEIEFLRPLAGAVSRGPSFTDIEKTVGRTVQPD